MTDPRHALFGRELELLSLACSRGPAFIAVALPDGRRRLLRRAATDLEQPPVPQAVLPRISARALPPLARHIRSMLAASSEEAFHADRPQSDPSTSSAAGNIPPPPAVVGHVAPFGVRLDRLHEVLQAAMGWTGSHLYEIRARDVGWGVPDADFGDGPLDARKARLVDVLEDVGMKTIKYLYDFGDGWEHTVKIERIIDAVPGLAYPVLFDAIGRCPPEDVGGPWGYAGFLDTLADPAHENHADTKEWIGEDFDPNTVKFDELAGAVAKLAKAWARKPPTKCKLAE